MFLRVYISNNIYVSKMVICIVGKVRFIVYNRETSKSFNAESGYESWNGMEALQVYFTPELRPKPAVPQHKVTHIGNTLSQGGRPGYRRYVSFPSPNFICTICMSPFLPTLTSPSWPPYNQSHDKPRDVSIHHNLLIHPRPQQLKARDDFSLLTDLHRGK
jgi:hypothetical protein